MSVEQVRVCDAPGCEKRGGLADVDWIKIEQRTPPAAGRIFSSELRWDYCSDACFQRALQAGGISVVPAPSRLVTPDVTG